MDWVIGFSAIVSMLATVAIAIFAWINNKLANQIRDEDKSNQQQISDLYQAIVISTLISGPTSTGAFHRAVELFEKNYNGKTKIF